MHDSVGNNGNNVHNSTTQYFTYIWHHIFFDNGACCGLGVQVPYFAALFGLPPLWQIGAQLFKPPSEPKFPACLRYIKDMPLRRGLKCVSQRYFFQDTLCAKLQLQWRQNPLSFSQEYLLKFGVSDQLCHFVSFLVFLFMGGGMTRFKLTYFLHFCPVLTVWFHCAYLTRVTISTGKVPLCKNAVGITETVQWTFHLSFRTLQDGGGWTLDE